MSGPAPVNVHATGIVIGTRGFLFVGPSGCGKTSAALTCLAQAQARGLHAALVCDDQVMLSRRNDRVVAEAIASIAGRAEVRGAEIVPVPATAAAVMDFAVRPFREPVLERLPPEKETFHVDAVGELPLLRLPVSSPEMLDILLKVAEAHV
jgi:serine kinase of HPr protein (carbohydrate metabolism regulator)